ncbi:MAG TPA: hypothetical protein VF765_21600 [Polyangiaceae bacterium]
MIYRKSSPNPPRMLLRVVAAAGASAVAIGAGACGSSAGPEAPGFIDGGWDVVICADGCGIGEGGEGGGFYQEAGGDGDAFSPADAHDSGGTESGSEGGGEAGAD